MERNPYDGKPYYCADCGLGWSEVMACEDGPCTMETLEEAEARAAKQARLIATCAAVALGLKRHA